MSRRPKNLTARILVLLAATAFVVLHDFNRDFYKYAIIGALIMMIAELYRDWKK